MASRGSGINGVFEALRTHQEQIRFVQVRHEEAAAFMACSWAKHTGKLGACIATSGPGGIHLLNGLYDAKLDTQPVIAITGLQYHDLIGTCTQQDVELDKLFMDVCVYDERIMGANHVQNVVDLFSMASQQIKWEQMVFLGNPEYGVELHPIDFAAFAYACGGVGFVLDDPKDVGESGGTVPERTRPSYPGGRSGSIHPAVAAQDPHGAGAEVRLVAPARQAESRTYCLDSPVGKGERDDLTGGKKQELSVHGVDVLRRQEHEAALAVIARQNAAADQLGGVGIGKFDGVMRGNKRAREGLQFFVAADELRRFHPRPRHEQHEEFGRRLVLDQRSQCDGPLSRERIAGLRQHGANVFLPNQSGQPRSYVRVGTKGGERQSVEAGGLLLVAAFFVELPEMIADLGVLDQHPR
jgi:hypothetical protein